MVWIIVPVRRVKRIVYYCPRCGRKERFYFSLLPLLKPVWPCRGCRTKIVTDHPIMKRSCGLTELL